MARFRPLAVAMILAAAASAIGGCSWDGSVASERSDPSPEPDRTAEPVTSAPSSTGAEPDITPSTTTDTEPLATPQWAPGPLAGEQDGAEVPSWTVEVVATRPHDASAFTQGIEVHEGTLYESTGLTGESTVRTVDIDSGEVTAVLDLDPDVFAEGLTVADDQIIQLTWQSGIAYVRDIDSLESVGQFSYEGEGWGICHDGEQLVMSDGSASLVRRDRSTFDVVDVVDVSLDGQPVQLLNELECVDGYVLANVWMTDTIVVVDPRDGRVRARIDASALTLDAVGAGDTTRLLNGIAQLDDDTFLLTGKLWPSMYQVRLVTG